MAVDLIDRFERLMLEMVRNGKLDTCAIPEIIREGMNNRRLLALGMPLSLLNKRQFNYAHSLFRNYRR